jgi:hypothetical protein
MESNRMSGARRNEVGYCGNYCRTCYWYTDALRKPASQLLELVKNNFEVAGWINYKGGDSEKTLKGLEILSKCACTFNCKGGSGWSGCPVRKCCITKGFDFCFECLEFPCERNWGEKSEHTNVFTADKIKQLQEMKEIGVEEWIRKQWEKA